MSDFSSALVEAGDGLTRTDAILSAALGVTLELDANGNIRVIPDLADHPDNTANPHGVTDDQTGAATALGNHAGDASAHHTKYSPTVLASGTVSADWPDTHLPGVRSDGNNPQQQVYNVDDDLKNTVYTGSSNTVMMLQYSKDSSDNTLTYEVLSL